MIMGCMHIKGHPDISHQNVDGLLQSIKTSDVIDRVISTVLNDLTPQRYSRAMEEAVGELLAGLGYEDDEHFQYTNGVQASWDDHLNQFVACAGMSISLQYNLSQTICRSATGYRVSFRSHGLLPREFSFEVNLPSKSSDWNWHDKATWLALGIDQELKLRTHEAEWKMVTEFSGRVASGMPGLYINSTYLTHADFFTFTPIQDPDEVTGKAELEPALAEGWL